MFRVPARKPEIIWREIQGDTVLLNSANGEYYGINQVGLSIWEKIDGCKSLASILQLLLDEYDVDEDILKSDLLKYIQIMHQQELLFFIEQDS